MIQGDCTVCLMCHDVFDNLLAQFLPYSERQWIPIVNVTDDVYLTKRDREEPFSFNGHAWKCIDQ